MNKDDEMDGACSAYGKNKKYIQNFARETQKRRDHLISWIQEHITTDLKQRGMRE